MTTHCISGKIAFQPHFRRRDQAMIEHSLEALVRQRMFALALGHEDVNDHDQLRHDRLLALACGRKDLDGATRRRARDRGIPLAGKSTLNRLEDCSASAADHHRHHRIAADIAAMDDLLVALFVESFDQPPDRIVLDVDATDMPLHGRQEGRFFHGYYDEYCHLPLYIFCGERLLCAKLRTSNRDAGDGLVEELERIVPQLRAAWPETRIVVRGQRRPPPVRPGTQQAGQVPKVLDIREVVCSVFRSWTGPLAVSYSSSSSFLTAVIWRRSKPVIPIGRHFCEARVIAANISFNTGLSPQALGITFMRRRSSPNRRSSRFVVRIALRCRTGMRRWAMQASKSSRKQDTAVGNSRSKSLDRFRARSRAMARDGAWYAALARSRKSGHASSREILAARLLMR